MKTIKPIILMLFLFSTMVNAQHNYTSSWEKVKKFERDNLPKSALQVVNSIYKKAEKENNSSQIIKCLFHKSKYSLVLEEDAQLLIINSFKKHINKSSFPTKNVLENILANLYWQYFNGHRWQFYNRTKTAHKVDATDFRTWDLQTLFTEIHTHYQASLLDKERLQKIDIHKFADILQIEKGSKKYRPTLFDFLANEALVFYKTNETHITKPAYQFTLDNPDLLSDATSFSHLQISSKDTLSLQFNALKIYQNLIQFHLKQNNIVALADIDLERLHFVKQHAIFNDKETIFINTLLATEKKYISNSVSTLYAYEVANIYHQQATFTNEKLRFKNKEALAICNTAIKRFPNSSGSKKCTDLKNVLLNKTVSITAEKYIPIKSHTRLLINYLNINNLYFSALAITKEEYHKLNNIHKKKEKVDFIKKLKNLKSWQTSLPNEHDYLQHSTEIVVPELAQGNYLIVASENPKITSKTVFGFANIQVTDIALIELHDSNSYSYQIVNRNTGSPIKGAKVHIKNYNHDNYNSPIDISLQTDKEGFVFYKNKDIHYNIIITVTNGSDVAHFGNFNFYEQQVQNEDFHNDITQVKPFIFTDRSIYRPGQTVYFKTILISNKGTISKPLANEHISLTLENPNGQAVKELTLKLNEYGAASGEIVLPNDGLTGSYHFRISESNKKGSFFTRTNWGFTYSSTGFNISVEAYKRPTFETDFNPINEVFTINSLVKINGFAKGFSGAGITNGKVVYRVHRKVQFPHWCYWYRPLFNSEPQEITHGETKTDDSGNFTISFNALADNSVPKKNMPIFTYEVTADVTDINGETHSATANVRVGYHALTATIMGKYSVDKNDKEAIFSIDTKNLNGVFIPTKGNFTIYKLTNPSNPLRKRPWLAPDYQSISESEFRKLFPNDPYTDNEYDMNSWKKGALVFNTDFNTESTKDIKLENFTKWNSGAYIAIVNTKDKFGQVVKDEFRFWVKNRKKKEIIDTNVFSYTLNKKHYTAGDNVLLQVASASKDITVVIEVEKKHKVVLKKLLHLSNSIETVKIPVTKDDIGGFNISYYYVNYNDFNNGNIAIEVVNNTSITSIETHTFRDKLEPRSKQTWSFSIKNDKKSTITAEVLASMYDASLDQFKPHSWSFNPITQKRYYTNKQIASAHYSFGTSYFSVYNLNNHYTPYYRQVYDSFNWFGFSFNNNYGRFRKMAMSTNDMATPMLNKSAREASFENEDKDILLQQNNTKGASVVKGSASLNGKEPIYVIDGEIVYTNNVIDKKEIVNIEILKGKEATDLYGNKASNGAIVITTKAGLAKLQKAFSSIKVRKNLQETAFFYPHLKTDSSGNVSFSFTTPEALTRWKLQLLAYTKELESATKTLQTVTQKALMVTPNVPRFIRTGDTITLRTKITNLSDTRLQGMAQLTLTDAITGKPVNLFTDNQHASIPFGVDKDKNTDVSWNLVIPNTVQALQYKIVAKAGNFSDGEQNVLPVLSNKMLVTETIPMWIGSNEKKTFTLAKLANSASKKNTTLKHHQLTLEVTSNPAWYAVQALPYLMETPYESAEHIFSRYYANTLANYIAKVNPRIQAVFNAWKSSDALLSNLEKNENLKSLLIEETPWLRDVQSETEQKKRIALLFDMNKMIQEQKNSISKLLAMQLPNGGFPWFKGKNYANRIITQHIATGFGHLAKLGVTVPNNTSELCKKAVLFLDTELVSIYNELLKQADKIKAEKGKKAATDFLNDKHIGYFELQYLYMRSFYTTITKSNTTKKAFDYYNKQAATYWNDFNLYGKGLLALTQFRNGNKKIAHKIIQSLKENSITSPELGMYWKENKAGWYWHQAPIETQALLIEAFAEIENNTTVIDNLKIWLLKNKQVTNWKTSKATTEAIYALLLQGSDWISVTNMVDVQLGDKKVTPLQTEATKVTAGTGYFKTSWKGTEITPNMGTVTLTKKDNGIAWGALYWQYFETLDRITTANTSLQITKHLFKKVNSATGKELKKITNNTPLQIGDLVTVRITLRTDRDMEFIHLKDMRAAGFEPINVLSSYKWQDGLGYYESTKDATTNFFFDWLPKGVYVFEYDVRVNNTGSFSNGITTIQSMYAPEFSGHSAGDRIKIK